MLKVLWYGVGKDRELSFSLCVHFMYCYRVMQSFHDPTVKLICSNKLFFLSTFANCVTVTIDITATHATHAILPLHTENGKHNLTVIIQNIQINSENQLYP